MEAYELTAVRNSVNKSCRCMWKSMVHCRVHNSNALMHDLGPHQFNPRLTILCFKVGILI